MRKTKIRETVFGIVLIVLVILVAAFGSAALGYTIPGLSAITDAFGFGG
jgi:hypothetical protein